MKAHGAKRPGRMMRPEVGLARWEIMRHVERTRNKGCRGCRYWCEYGTCDYILREGHRRGVPMAPRRGLREKDNREEPEMTAQEIKKNYEAREAEQVNREMDELLEVLRPAMERNVKRKREEIKRKNRAERRKRVAASRKRRVNRLLSEAGIPLRVL